MSFLLPESVKYALKQCSTSYHLMGTKLSDIYHHGFIQIMEEDGARLERPTCPRMD